MTDASVSNQHNVDHLREYIPVLVIGGFITGLIAAAFGGELYQDFSIGSLIGLLVAASLCVACVIPVAARVLAGIREALKIPAAALRRVPLFEVAELPTELRRSLRPLVRPSVRYLTLLEMQRVTKSLSGIPGGWLLHPRSTG